MVFYLKNAFFKKIEEGSGKQSAFSDQREGVNRETGDVNR
jgi:hypothetical protein